MSLLYLWSDLILVWSSSEKAPSYWHHVPALNETLIGVSSDGAGNMTGAPQGVVTRLQHYSTMPGFIRVSCMLHLLEIKLEKECRL